MVTFLEHLEAPTGAPIAVATKIAAMLEHPTLAVSAVEGGRIRRTNATWSAMFAQRSQVPLEAHVVTLFPSANSADRFEKGLQAEFKRNGLVACLEHMLVRRDGAAFLAEIVVHLFDASQIDHALAADAIWQVRDITAERELRRELRELEEYYQALSTHQWDLSFVIDARDCISFASPSVEAALGYRPHLILGEPFSSLLMPEGATAGMHWLRSGRRPVEERPRDSFRLRVAHRDGELRFLSCRLRNCLDVPRIAGLVIHARDVTDEVLEEQKAATALVRAAALRERLFALATAPGRPFADRMQALLGSACESLATAGASYWRVLDGDGRQLLECQYASVAGPSDGALPLVDPLGEVFDPAESPDYDLEWQKRRPIVVDDVADHPAIDAAHRARLSEARIGAFLDFPVASGGAIVGMLSVGHAGGPRSWATEEIDFAGGIALLAAVALESRQRDEASRRIGSMALHDGLTGLSSRPAAEQELERRIAVAAQAGGVLAVVIVDLDLFKDVNDIYGYPMGNAVLVAVARLLAELAGPDALVARMAADEFLVVLDETHTASADRTVRQVLERLSSDILIEGVDQPIGASVGVARFPADGVEAPALLLHADIAMHESKRRGRGQSFTFNSRLAEGLRLQRELDGEIQAALSGNELCLFYQPQLDFATGAVIGFEALLRWQHPTRGLLLPAAFMPSALHRGMTEVITKWVITQVCEQIVAWRRAGDDADVPVSVNVTGRQFHDRRLPAIVAGALLKSALPARMLILEVDEHSLTGNDVETQRVVKELSRLGVRIAISGFGVGYSSLDALRRLLVAQVKLDRRFIGGLPGDVDSSVVVAAIVGIARRLDYQVVAEGVETAEQLEYLREIGCEAGQGFYIGAPASADDLRGFLRSHPKRLPR